MIPAGELGSTIQVLLLTYPLAVALLCLTGSRFRVRKRRPASSLSVEACDSGPAEYAEWRHRRGVLR